MSIGMAIWNDETIDYFKKMNKPGCEGEYVRAITSFVHHDCVPDTIMGYEELIKDLIIKTKR